MSTNTESKNKIKTFTGVVFYYHSITHVKTMELRIVRLIKAIVYRNTRKC